MGPSPHAVNWSTEFQSRVRAEFGVHPENPA
jgi:hypothetical protein